MSHVHSSWLARSPHLSRPQVKSCTYASAMLRCIHRSLPHTNPFSQVQSFCSPVKASGPRRAICGETWVQHFKSREHQIPSWQSMCMRPLSSALSSAVRGRGNDRKVRSNPSQEPPVVPNGKLPPNLKLAVEVQEVVEGGAASLADDALEVTEDQDAYAGEQGELPRDGESFASCEQEKGGPVVSTEVGVVSWLGGDIVGTRSLDPQVFGVPIRRDVVHDVIRWQLAKRRAGNAKTKRIGEISGSGRKVRPQKKQGIARAGHSRPPHWRGGAKAHGPRPRDWSFKLNKKYLKLGLRVALSARLREGRLKVVDALDSDNFSTSSALNSMEARGVDTSVLFIDRDFPKAEFMKSVNNIIGVKVLPTGGANVYDIVRRTDLVITEAGVSHLEEVLKPI